MPLLFTLSEQEKGKASNTLKGKAILEEVPMIWQEQANCKGLEFFLEPGNLGKKRKVCKSCEVKAECLSFALEHKDETSVVYAGTTGSQRKALL